MRCKNPMCELSQGHAGACPTTDGPVWFTTQCADVGELRAELEDLRAGLKMFPDNQRLKAEVAIVENRLQAARGAKGE